MTTGSRRPHSSGLTGRDRPAPPREELVKDSRIQRNEQARNSGTPRISRPRPPRPPFLGKVKRLLMLSGAAAAVFGAAIVGYFALSLPDLDAAALATRRPSIVVLAEDDSVIARYGDAYGDPLPVEDLSPWIPAAVIAIEDRKFYSHFGVDPLGLVRAALVNLRAGHAVQGGSTITQQAVKNLFLSSERTLKRKVQEVLLALWLEHTFSKDQILSLYLNRVYLGAGTYGMDAAAHRYFGVSARDVTPFQAAVLAGLLKAPSRYNPVNDPQAAADRAAVVLRAMEETGALTAAQAQDAQAERHRLAATKPAPRVGRYFSDWIQDQIDDLIGSVIEDVEVHTTLNPKIQQVAEQSLSKTLTSSGEKVHASQGAVVVLSPDGAVRAMVGGADYGSSQYNRAVQAQRQPGSSFKPFVYLAGVENGLRPDDMVEDAPITIGKWSPENFDHKYRGMVTLREAVAASLNTVAVRVSERAGRDHVIEVAHRLGITAELQDSPSLALGTQETALLPLVSAYAPFANGGQGVTPYGIRDVVTRDGVTIYQHPSSERGQVIRPQDVAIMNDLLSGVVDYGTARNAAFGRPAAGKTGTSADYRDAWFVGYTADYITGVWVGNDDNSPMKRVTGGSLPATVWKNVMVAAHQGVAVHSLPSAPSESDPFTSLIRSVLGLGRDSSPTPAPAPDSRSRTTPPPSELPEDNAAPEAPAPSSSSQHETINLLGKSIPLPQGAPSLTPQNLQDLSTR